MKFVSVFFFSSGVHCEGPFINKEKRGAHHPDFITSPTNGISDLEAMYGCLDDVCLVTLAPELPGALQTTKELVKQGITVSVGKLTIKFCYKNFFGHVNLIFLTVYVLNHF